MSHLHDSILSTYNVQHFSKLLSLIAREKRNVSLPTSLEKCILQQNNDGTNHNIDTSLSSTLLEQCIFIARERSKKRVEEEEFERTFQEEMQYEEDGVEEENDDRDEEESSYARFVRYTSSLAEQEEQNEEETDEVMQKTKKDQKLQLMNNAMNMVLFEPR